MKTKIDSVDYPGSRRWVSFRRQNRITEYWRTSAASWLRLVSVLELMAGRVYGPRSAGAGWQYWKLPG